MANVALDASLLDAKLSVPQPRPGSVSRWSSSRPLASECRVIGVTAPPGYGKSTLLVQWAHAEDRRVAWMSLDHLDDDPALLLTLLASAYTPGCRQTMPTWSPIWAVSVCRCWGAPHRDRRRSGRARFRSC